MKKYALKALIWQGFKVKTTDPNEGRKIKGAPLLSIPENSKIFCPYRALKTLGN